MLRHAGGISTVFSAMADWVALFGGEDHPSGLAWCCQPTAEMMHSLYVLVELRTGMRPDSRVPNFQGGTICSYTILKHDEFSEYRTLETGWMGRRDGEGMEKGWRWTEMDGEGNGMRER